MKKRKKLRKNLAALIALSLLFLSAFVFPLFGTSIFGESFSNKRSEEHTSELQSHSFISYAVFCLKKKKKSIIHVDTNIINEVI